MKEGTKPELGHWFELILDSLAILNQLLSCESNLQNQLSVFLGGPCCGYGHVDIDRSRNSFYKRDFASMLTILDHEGIQNDFGIGSPYS